MIYLIIIIKTFFGKEKNRNFYFLINGTHTNNGMHTNKPYIYLSSENTGLAIINEAHKQ